MRAFKKILFIVLFIQICLLIYIFDSESGYYVDDDSRAFPWEFGLPPSASEVSYYAAGHFDSMEAIAFKCSLSDFESWMQLLSDYYGNFERKDTIPVLVITPLDLRDSEKSAGVFLDGPAKRYVHYIDGKDSVSGNVVEVVYSFENSMAYYMRFFP